MSPVIRVLHAADFHLGSPFSGLSAAKAGIRKSEQQDTFMRMIEICKSERIQVLLLAGDLFDAIHISAELKRLFVDALNSLSHTRIFIAPGNHDPYLYSSVYQSASFESHVHIFNSGMESVYCEDLDVVVWGAAFSSSRKNKSLWPDGFNVQDTGVGTDQSLHLVVMHGDLIGGINEKSAYNPIRLSDIERCGADYVALGHVHDRTPVQYAGNTAYAYAGCPEGRGYDEHGPRGIYVGEISNDYTELQQFDINSRSYFCIQVDVTGCGTQQAIYLRVKEVISQKYGMDYLKHAYRITLLGELPEDLSVEVSGLRAQIGKDVFDVRVYDQTRAEIKLDHLIKEKSLRGAFAEQMVRRIEASENDVERAKNLLALRIGLKSFEGEVLYREDS